MLFIFFIFILCTLNQQLSLCFHLWEESGFKLLDLVMIKVCLKNQCMAYNARY